MTNEEAKDLLDRYNLGECTEGEKALLEKWYMELGKDEGIDVSLDRIEGIKYEVLERLPVGEERAAVRVKLWQGAVAIAAMVLLTLGTWQLFFGFVDKPQGLVVAEVKAGGNRAMLTVSGGRQIALDGRGDGVLIGTDSVSYMGGGAGAGVALAAGRQTLATPRGGQFKLVLSDGTKVWLNAASSIAYPSSFSGLAERRVEITGEVYFEVAHNRAVPFRVVSSGQVVEVLGTHFNVNGYGDEGRTVTTLAEGSVRVLSLGKPLLLRPGQRAIVSAAGSGPVVEAADLETELAWKNGMLEFRDADLRSILRTVSRWYDIDIEYRGEVAPRSFTGSVPRSSDLSVLLRILEYSNVHFKIEHGAGSSGRKLVVMP